MAAKTDASWRKLSTVYCVPDLALCPLLRRICDCATFDRARQNCLLLWLFQLWQWMAELWFTLHLHDQGPCLTWKKEVMLGWPALRRGQREPIFISLFQSLFVWILQMNDRAMCVSHYTRTYDMCIFWPLARKYLCTWTLWLDYSDQDTEELQSLLNRTCAGRMEQGPCSSLRLFPMS